MANELHQSLSGASPTINSPRRTLVSFQPRPAVDVLRIHHLSGMLSVEGLLKVELDTSWYCMPDGLFFNLISYFPLHLRLTFYSLPGDEGERKLIALAIVSSRR